MMESISIEQEQEQEQTREHVEGHASPRTSKHNIPRRPRLPPLPPAALSIPASSFASPKKQHQPCTSEPSSAIVAAMSPRSKAYTVSEKSSSYLDTVRTFTESIREVRIADREQVVCHSHSHTQNHPLSNPQSNAKTPDRLKTLSDYGSNTVTYSVNEYSPRFRKHDSGQSLLDDSVESLEMTQCMTGMQREFPSFPSSLDLNVKPSESTCNLKGMVHASPRAILFSEPKQVPGSPGLSHNFKSITLAPSDVKPWFTKNASARYSSVDRLETILEDENESGDEDGTNSNSISDTD
mmetsp:Transcript_18427/g.31954  ORF Transcript_18427/g.31954 Transcript_18427/m.31954 type:complete len:295 (+) Transcript_18427:197-1081(+)